MYVQVPTGSTSPALEPRRFGDCGLANPERAPAPYFAIVAGGGPSVCGDDDSLEP